MTSGARRSLVSRQALREAFRELRCDLEEIFNRIGQLEWRVAQLRNPTEGNQ